MYLTFVEVQHSHPTYHGRLLSPQSSPCRGDRRASPENVPSESILWHSWL